MQCSGLCEPEHAVHGYLMCDVRWHALQRQHMSGKGSNLVTPRALFFCSSHLLGAEVWLYFFFLWYGRSRSKARSLHEKKLLRKLLHGTQVVACSLANHKNQNKNHQKKQGKTQIPQPDLRLTIQRTAKQTANGARAQQKQPQKICQGHSGKNPLCRN